MQDCALALRATLSPWVSSILLMYFLLATPPEYPFFLLEEDAVGWIFIPVVRSKEILVFRCCHDENGSTLCMNLLFGSKL